MAVFDFARIEGATVSERFGKAMEYLRNEPGSELSIPAGTYVITSERARETMECAISGRYGENPEGTMFRPGYAFTEGISFSGIRGAVIRAEGVKLMVDGFMEPLALKDCSDIRIEGLTIDYVRKPFSMGVIETFEKGAEPGTACITAVFDERFPVDEHTIMPRVCAYDPEKAYFHIGMRVSDRTYLGNGRMAISLARIPDIDLTGMEFYLWHSFHYRPAILIENAERIALEDVTIHAQPGMGIVGHRSSDILLKRLKVAPSEGLHMSTNTDATHFTSCRGYLRFEECEFEGHGDDATNVHTFYHDFEAVSPGRRTVRTRVDTLTHSLTLDYADAGDTLELNERGSLLPRDSFTVLKSEPDFADGTALLTLDHPVPEGAEGMYLSNLSQMPRLSFVNCTCNNHWARSVLIKTRDAEVRGCTFRASALYAIHVAAEEGWHEGIAPAGIRITNNRFIACGEPARTAIGGICVEMSADEPSGTPISDIEISDNEFILPKAKTAICVRNAENVRILRNRIDTASREKIIVSDCKDVRID